MEKGLESIHIANNFGADWVLILGAENVQRRKLSPLRNQNASGDLHSFAGLLHQKVMPK
jgi:hypothetical protein